MFQIGKTVVSNVVFDHAFCCDLSKCKGACCVDGDAGAPLMPNEVKIYVYLALNSFKRIGIPKK